MFLPKQFSPYPQVLLYDHTRKLSKAFAHSLYLALLCHALGLVTAVVGMGPIMAQVQLAYVPTPSHCCKRFTELQERHFFSSFFPLLVFLLGSCGSQQLQVVHILFIQALAATMHWVFCIKARSALLHMIISLCFYAPRSTEAAAL